MLGVVRARRLLAACLAGQALDVQASLQQPLFVPENQPALTALEMFKQTARIWPWWSTSTAARRAW